MVAQSSQKDKDSGEYIPNNLNENCNHRKSSVISWLVVHGIVVNEVEQRLEPAGIEYDSNHVMDCYNSLFVFAEADSPGGTQEGE